MTAPLRLCFLSRITYIYLIYTLGLAQGLNSGNLEELGFQLTTFQSVGQHLNHWPTNVAFNLYV